MSKKKELVKRALNHPELFTEAELTYFKLWLRYKKMQKQQKKDDKRPGYLADR